MDLWIQIALPASAAIFSTERRQLQCMPQCQPEPVYQSTVFALFKIGRLSKVEEIQLYLGGIILVN
jgi:hypothetical protein